MKKNKVVYIHRKATDGVIFYVGIGNKYRPKNKENRSRYWKRTVDKHDYTIHIVEEGLTQEEARESEIALIELIGRRDLGLGTLVNLSDGGEGANGHISTRRIQVIDLNNGKIYKSITEASKTVKIAPSDLINCINGIRSTKRVSHFRGIDTDGNIKWKSEDDEGVERKEFVYKEINWVERLAYDLESRGDLDLRDEVIYRKNVTSSLKAGRPRSYNPGLKVEKLRDYIKKILF